MKNITSKKINWLFFFLTKHWDSFGKKRNNKITDITTDKVLISSKSNIEQLGLNFTDIPVAHHCKTDKPCLVKYDDFL
jgi:hypothetical protein